MCRLTFLPNNITSIKNQIKIVFLPPVLYIYMDQNSSRQTGGGLLEQGFFYWVDGDTRMAEDYLFKGFEESGVNVL